MSKKRLRPLLLKPVFHGAPISWARKFFQQQLEKYRQANPDFDSFLKGVEQIIWDRYEPYYFNILKFLRGEAETNWVSPSNSLLEMFVKLYNYDFSSRQAVNYIKTCHKIYDYLLSNKLKLANEYQIITKTCRWDGISRDFLDVDLVPASKLENQDDYYWIHITFCPLQGIEDSPDDFNDTEIELRSGRDIYEDALCLFDRYQGSRFFNQCLDLAIVELLKHNLVSKPIKIDYTSFKYLFYGIKHHNYFKITDK